MTHHLPLNKYKFKDRDRFHIPPFNLTYTNQGMLRIQYRTPYFNEDIVTGKIYTLRFYYRKIDSKSYEYKFFESDNTDIIKVSSSWKTCEHTIQTTPGSAKVIVKVVATDPHLFNVSTRRDGWTADADTSKFLPH